jgi:hypothetical protein
MAGLCGSWASGLQEEAGAVVGLEVGLFADLVEVPPNGGGHSGRLLACRTDCLWALCRMWHSWTAITGNNSVGIIIVFIIREDLEGVVVLCHMLVYDGQLSDSVWHRDGVRRCGHPQRCCNCHPWRCGRHHPRRYRIRGWGIGLASHDGGELPNGIKMFQLGSGRSWDCTS